MALEDQSVGGVQEKIEEEMKRILKRSKLKINRDTRNNQRRQYSPSAGRTCALIPNLAQEELNEWERENILLAREWATQDRTSPIAMASDEYVRKLHGKMFDETWKWAGTYRLTEKNIGVPVHEIRERLVALFRNVRYWIENSTYSADETAVRFHHRLVLIHPFPNGNGRHARDIWKRSERRINGDIQLLLKAARS